MKEVTINDISFSVGLADVWGGKMWFFCECHQDCRPSIYWFWTKKELENHLRTLKSKTIKRKVLAMLRKVHGRAICYAH